MLLSTAVPARDGHGPSGDQAGALWAADQLKDAKGNGHVMGTGSWQGPSVPPWTHSHQRDPPRCRGAGLAWSRDEDIDGEL